MATQISGEIDRLNDLAAPRTNDRGREVRMSLARAARDCGVSLSERRPIWNRRQCDLDHHAFAYRQMPWDGSQLFFKDVISGTKASE